MAGPLSNLRVVEIAEGIAGPYCGMVLGDAGANVIKIEPLTGDVSRSWQQEAEFSVADALTRNKRSISINLESEVGIEIVTRLFQHADVVIADPQRIPASLRYENIHHDMPRAIYCNISGFGDRGPWANRPAGELPAQMLSEATSSLGAIGEPPIRLGTDVGNMYAAIYAVQGILACLFHRGRTGVGQLVDVSLFGALLQMRSTLWVALSNPDEWWGFHLDNYIKPPFSGYQCKDGAIYFQFQTANPVDWDDLYRELDMEWVKDDPLEEYVRTDRGGNTGRYSHVVQHLWERAFERFPREKVIDILERHGAVAYPVNTYKELAEHPQVQKLHFIQHDSFTNTPFIAPPWRFSNTTTDGVRWPMPHIGEHTVPILTEMGISTSKIAEYIEKGIVGSI